MTADEAAEVTPAVELVDAHCHLDSDRLDAPVEAIVEEARRGGVTALVMAGVDPEGWRAQAALARRFPGIALPVYGLHPWVAAELAPNALDDALAALLVAARDEPRPVALGETGLDAYTPTRKARLHAQEASLRGHLDLCRRLDLPVVLHLLKAHEPALRVLREVGVPPAGGMVHSFSGSAELARAYVALGLHVSFSGSLTWPQSRRLRAAAAAVPLDRVLIETDSPDQTPHPHRGTPNRPGHLPLVAQALAEVRAVPLETIAAQTRDNTRRLLRLH